MGEMTSGTGEVYSDQPRNEPVMTTGDGRVLSGPDKGSTVASDLEDMSKAELYEKAAEAGVKGRSGMKKEELKEALEESG